MLKLHSFILESVSSGITALGTPVFYVLTVAILAVIDPSTAVRLAGIVIAVEIAGAAIKLSYKTVRPAPRPATTLLERYDAGSFPSIHAARAGALAAVLFLRDYYTPFVWIAIVVALAVGWSRVYLRHHRIVDVLGGFVLAGALSYVILRVW